MSDEQSVGARDSTRVGMIQLDTNIMSGFTPMELQRVLSGLYPLGVPMGLREAALYQTIPIMFYSEMFDEVKSGEQVPTYQVTVHRGNGGVLHREKVERVEEIKGSKP
tara:strand:+ start:123 stop:446 length:324 start_codon:yes stop_codon:yes gene_type:complete